MAAPNRVIYADALDVLYCAYRETLKIPEDMLYSMLRSKLEQQLAEAIFEGEDIEDEELRDISGRARFRHISQIQRSDAFLQHSYLFAQQGMSGNNLLAVGVLTFFSSVLYQYLFHDIVDMPILQTLEQHR